MSGSNADFEWYLARDGQQHGPLTDPELRKFIELGHLLPTDLVWRAGFPEWKTASEIFPETEPAAPPPETDVADQPDEQQPSPSRQQSQPATQAATRPAVADSEEHLDRTERTDIGARTPEAAAETAPEDRPEQTPEPASEPGPQRSGQRAAPARDEPVNGGVGGNVSARSQGGPQGRAGGADAQDAPLHQPQRSPSNTAHGPHPEPRAGRPIQPGAAHSGSAPQTSSIGPAHGGPQPGLANQHHQHAAQPADRRYRPHRQPQQGYASAAAPGAGRPGPNSKPTLGPADQRQAGQHGQIQSRDNNDDLYEDFEDDPRRRPYLVIAASLIFVAVIGAGGWFAYANQALLSKIITDLTQDQDKTKTGPAVVAAPASPSRTAPPKPANEQVQVPAASGRPVASIQPRLSLLNSAFWQALKQQDADWAGRQEKAIERLRQQGKSADELVEFSVGAVVDWRRSNADRVLSAAPDHLRKLAQTFVENLKYLVSKDVQACYGFISKGELSPAVLPFYKEPAPTKVLGSQMEAIIAAARNDGQSATKYLQPSPPDFRKLAQLLLQRGWTEDDLKLFSNPDALSSAPADKVCRLVTEWFDTQLQMPPSDLQMRLLATSLSPVVRG